MKKILVVILALILCMGTLAACATVKAPLDLAKDYLYAMYKDDAEATPSDYDLVAVVNKDGVVYTVTWTVNVDSVKIVPSEDGTKVTIDVPDKAEADIPYILTATVTSPEGKTATVTFNRKVPMFKELTYAEYIAAKDASTVVVKGVITGIHSKATGATYDGFYMQDENGGYYIYSLADGVKIEDYKIGMTVRATGEKKNYSGTHEVLKAAVEVIDSNVTAVTPADYTEIYKEAADLAAEALLAKQSFLVTVKGVEITAAGDNGYYKFELAGKESYIRISSSTCPMSTEAIDTFKAEYANHIGWIANATGLVSVYNGNFYLTPVSADAFEYVSLPEKTDAEAVAFEKEKLTLSANQITKDALTIDLPAAGAAYNKVAITWAVAGSDCAKIENGKLVVTELPAEKAELTLTATLKAGEATDTKEFKVNVDKKQTVALVPEKVENPVKDTAYKLALNQTNLGKTYYFAGTIDGTTSYRLATTDNPDNAVDVYLEEVTGGYAFYFYAEGNVKTYINPLTYNNGASLGLNTTASGAFTYDATLGVWVATVDSVSMYFGTYNQYDTISASTTDRLTGSNAANQFPVYLATMQETPMVPTAEKVEAPVKDTAYKLALNQTNLGKTYYFAGTIDGTTSYRLATTDNPDNAVDVYLEEVTGGYAFYFYAEGNVKTYINPLTYNNGASLGLNTTASGAFTYDATLGVWVATVDSVSMYFGTYNQYDTISASTTDRLTGSNAANQFPVFLATIVLKAPAAGDSGNDGGNQGGNGDGGNTPAPNPGASDVKTGVAYYITGVNANGGLYFNGTMNNGRVGATATKADAVAVYFEAGATAGQYYIYFMDGTTKTYISYVQNSSSKTASFVYTTTKDDTCLWTVDATAKKILSCVDATRGFGTDNTSTYENFSTYSTSNTQSKYVWCWIEEVAA